MPHLNYFRLKVLRMPLCLYISINSCYLSTHEVSRTCFLVSDPFSALLCIIENHNILVPDKQVWPMGITNRRLEVRREGQAKHDLFSAFSKSYGSIVPPFGLYQSLN